MAKGNIRVYCKKCQQWYDDEVDTSQLTQGKQGLFSVAFQHSDHILTVYIDKDLKVRGESVIDAILTKDESKSDEGRAIDFFDKM